ncbi:MAG: TAXI family TRAP transporter solute-binding subunit [Alkalilacustris sp.]
MTAPTRILAGVGLAAALTAVPAIASDIELPRTVSWTAYDTGSGSYNQAVAIGSALREATGTDLRLLPGRNDVARQVPLREGRVDFSATGIGATYFSQEGVFEFAEREWGPQRVRVLIASQGDANLAIGVAADTGARFIEDLRGKRVAWVVGAPALNENITAMLAFGGLTWDDVERVEFPGFGASWEGIVNNQVDAAFASTISGPAFQLEASPRGLTWIELPHDQEENWARFQEFAPFFTPFMATEGAGLSADAPHEGGTYPFPILIAYHDQDEDLVFNMTRAVVELFDDFADAAPGASGWALDRQSFEWAVPYHDGAIRYYRDIGVWTDAAQAHNDALIERQEVLVAAWEAFVATDPADDGFEQAWMEARAEALESAGMDVVFLP